MIFAVCYAIYMDWRSDKLESQLDARQEAVYGELLEGMDSLESKLYKLSLLPNSAKTPELLADIWRQTGELARDIFLPFPWGRKSMGRCSTF